MHTERLDNWLASGGARPAYRQDARHGLDCGLVAVPQYAAPHIDISSLIDWDDDADTAREYAAHDAETAIGDYIRGLRTDQQRAVLNDWLRAFGWCVRLLPRSGARS